MRKRLPEFADVNNLDDIIFFNRNKAYGAYELRTNYGNRLMKAFVIAISLSAILTYSTLLVDKYRKLNSPKKHGAIWGSDTLLVALLPENKYRMVAASSNHATQNKPVIVKDFMPELKKELQTDSSLFDGNQLQGKGKGHDDNTGTNRSEKLKTDSIINEEPEAEFLMMPQVMPSFPGGQKAFAKYLTRNFQCQNANSNPAEEGKIIIRFAVMSDGSLQHIEVLRENVGIDCTEEAMNILSHSPRWNPGLQNNKPVNVLMVLPITVQRAN